MRKIQTRKDLDDIRSDPQEAYREAIPMLARLFGELEAALGDGGEGFSLAEHGPIVLLELGDDLLDLRSAWLSESLFDTVPEEVSLVRAGSGAWVRVVALCNNEFAVFLFLPAEMLDRYPEGRRFVERWS